MNQQEKLAAFAKLEATVSDAVMSTAILNRLVEADTCRIFERTKDGEDYATIVVSREEAEHLMWQAGECLYRVRELHKAYFAALEG